MVVVLRGREVFFSLLFGFGFKIINNKEYGLNTCIAVLFYSLRGCSNLLTSHALCVETLLQNYHSIHFNAMFFSFFSSFLVYNVYSSVVKMKQLLNSYSCFWLCLNCYGPIFFFFWQFHKLVKQKTQQHQTCGEQWKLLLHFQVYKF